MRALKVISACLLCLPLYFQAQTKGIINIKNPSDFSRKETIVEIDWKKILEIYPDIDASNFSIINTKDKIQVAYQLETKGQTSVQNLLLQVSLNPKEIISLNIVKGKPSAFTAKTYGRFVPERKDDFAWENDKIAFRAYGKALELTPNENAYGIDVWVKRTDKLVIDERYKRGNYHIDNGDGMDYYHVGYTLGAGNISPFINDKIWYSKNYIEWKILDNGPLRTTFELVYDSWKAENTTVKLKKIISLDAGSQLNKIENIYSFDERQTLPVVVGISKRTKKGVMNLDENKALMMYWEPADAKNGTTGVGSILINSSKNMLVTTEHLLCVAEVQNNMPFVYYTGAAWDRAGEINSAKEWLYYLEKFYLQINEPLTITLKQQ